LLEDWAEMLFRMDKISQDFKTHTHTVERQFHQIQRELIYWRNVDRLLVFFKIMNTFWKYQLWIIFLDRVERYLVTLIRHKFSLNLKNLRILSQENDITWFSRLQYLNVRSLHSLIYSWSNEINIYLGNLW